MKVIAYNGSPKKNGNTYNTLKIVCDTLESQGIETEIVHIGGENIRGCLSCNVCHKQKNEKCVIDDVVNTQVQRLKSCDGIILGSPVYYAGLNGTMKSFLDRLFVVSGTNGNFLRHKVGCSVAAVRRSGGIPTVDQLNKYLEYSEMFMATTVYWPVIHGLRPGEVSEDTEGVNMMKTLGNNMAYLMKIVENSKGVIEQPEKIELVRTNFIR